ncbi:MAG: sigma-70 family RNA polymerase sigma factor [Sedimentisphaerales bacterium]|nr:sigma-70 family RNA polymerase sigma factor [Sedimentisphaerales bacterium]
MSIDNEKTQRLVALAKGGDQAALNQLCCVYSERVRRIIRFRLNRELRSKLDSVDVVQDVLILAMGGLRDFTYQSEGDFLRWLSRIAENKIRDIFDEFHADKRDIRKEIPFKEHRRQTGSALGGRLSPIAATTPSVIVRKKEALDRLEKALDELKPEYKQVIVLKRIEGFSHAEIAERLGKSAKAVSMLLSRAMTALTIAYGKD